MNHIIINTYLLLANFLSCVYVIVDICDLQVMWGRMLHGFITVWINGNGILSFKFYFQQGWRRIKFRVGEMQE